MQTTPQKTWNPWNPVVVKKTEPQGSLAEKLRRWFGV